MRVNDSSRSHTVAQEFCSMFGNKLALMHHQHELYIQGTIFHLPSLKTDTDVTVGFS